MSIFIKQGYVCKLEKDINEFDEHFQTRGLFLVSQKPTNQMEYQKAILFSRIYANYKFLGCIYDDQIMNELFIMENKLLME